MGGGFASTCGYKRQKKDCKSCKVLQQIQDEAKKQNIDVPQMAFHYDAGDSVGGLLHNAISL